MMNLLAQYTKHGNHETIFASPESNRFFNEEGCEGSYGNGGFSYLVVANTGY